MRVISVSSRVTNEWNPYVPCVQAEKDAKRKAKEKERKKLKKVQEKAQQVSALFQCSYIYSNQKVTVLSGDRDGCFSFAFDGKLIVKVSEERWLKRGGSNCEQVMTDLETNFFSKERAVLRVF